jgi:hypothetical protein
MSFIRPGRRGRAGLASERFHVLGRGASWKISSAPTDFRYAEDGRAIRFIPFDKKIKHHLIRPAAQRADWYARGVGGAAAREINKLPAALPNENGQWAGKLV